MTEQELEQRLNRLEEMVDLILESKSEHIFRGLFSDERDKLQKHWKELKWELFYRN